MSLVDVLPRARSFRVPSLSGLTQWIVPLVILAGWQIACVAGFVPARVMPAPSDVALAGWKLLRSGELGRNIWSNARAYLERSASGETQVLQQHLAGMFVRAGEALAGDAELRGEINQGLVAVLRSFIADQKSGVSSFISDQVKAWDMGQLIALIEVNIGRDLQYIRFNGSLIGGLAGLGLYTAEVLLRLL